jgi:small subunit ribosomal protein S16
MVKIRLVRNGKRNDPFYRIVVTDGRKKARGKFIEVVGYYHPKKSLKKLNTKKIKEWIIKGAQLTSAAGNLMK